MSPAITKLFPLLVYNIGLLADLTAQQIIIYSIRRTKKKQVLLAIGRQKRSDVSQSEKWLFGNKSKIFISIAVRGDRLTARTKKNNVRTERSLRRDAVMASMLVM